MADTYSMEQCAASCNAYISQVGISNSTAVFLWMFAPLGCIIISAFVGFAIFSGVKAFLGPRIFRARKEESLRKEREARERAMRLSGLEVEMGRMGRGQEEKGRWECEGV